METIGSLLLSASVPSPFYGGALLTSAYLSNRIPSSVIAGVSTYEILHSVKIDYSAFHVFGCSCFVLLLKLEHGKITAHSVLRLSWL